MGIIQQNLTARIRSWEQEELSLRAVYKVSTGLTIACTMDRSSSALSFTWLCSAVAGKGYLTLRPILTLDRVFASGWESALLSYMGINVG